MIKIYSKQSAMTLVEMLVVIGLFSVLSILIFGAAQTFYQTNSYSSAQAEEIDHARRGVTALTRDLREMTYAENGTFPVAEIEEYTIGFYSDIDKDNSVEYVRYVLEDGETNFYKRVYNPTGNPPVYNLTSPDEEFLMSQYVQNRNQSVPIFSYYDSNNNSVTSSQITDVRYIEAEVIVNIDPVRSPGEFMLRTSVAPRNLKDNL
jgi:prepilin-type N-terminal cleavage/methylation domain-containing protein